MSSAGRLAARADTLGGVAHDIIACTACLRLRRHCLEVARRGKPEFAGWTYWGRPVPGFGDPRAEVLIVGLAPAAHGGNRTGRMFTGDGSAAWLIRAMYQAGFANRPVSLHRGDGLRLLGAYLTAPVRCAPPKNRPTAQEIGRCLPFLRREIALLPRVRVLVALGRIAFDVCRRLLTEGGADVRGMRFAHGALYDPGPAHPALLACYHPSRQNTNTGKLTEAMLNRVFQQARSVLEAPAGAPRSVPDMQTVRRRRLRPVRPGRERPGPGRLTHV